MSAPGISSRTVAAIVVLLVAAGSLSAQPASDVDSLVAMAREAARTDRNLEAAQLFAEAVRVDPSRRAALLLELAEQMTYSGESRAAIPLFREVLRRPELPRGDEQRALSGLALALSWNEALGEALRLYEKLIALDPSSYAARRDRARLLSWRGRHRAARGELAALQRERPDDPETQILLAQAERWSGRPDLAAATLRRLLELQSDHRAAGTILRELERDMRPMSTVGSNVSNQSDGLGIASSWVDHDATYGNGRAEIGGRLESLRYTPDPGGGEGVLVWRPGVRGRYRFGDDWEGNARVFVDLVRPKGPDKPRDVLTFDSWLTYWPSDVVRIDAALGRTTFDNVRSQLLGIAALTGSVSADVTPDERLVLKGRVSHGELTDGNRRTGLTAEGAYRVLHRPRLLLGVRYTGFAFAEHLDGGYFNPERYQSISATLHAWGRVGPTLSWAVDASYGEEFVVPDGDKPTWGANGKLTWRPSETIEVEAWGGRFDSRVASSAGFARSWFGLSVGARW